MHETILVVDDDREIVGAIAILLENVFLVPVLRYGKRAA